MDSSISSSFPGIFRASINPFAGFEAMRPAAAVPGDRLESTGHAELDGCSQRIPDRQSKKGSVASIVHLSSPYWRKTNVIVPDFDGNHWKSLLAVRGEGTGFYSCDSRFGWLISMVHLRSSIEIPSTYAETSY